MVGKIKRVRQKLHQDAVKVHAQIGEKHLSAAEAIGLSFAPSVKTFAPKDVSEKLKCNLDIASKSSFPEKVFAGTKITPESLRQNLKYDNAPRSTPTDVQPGGGDVKKQQTKKEKMKERRERWLNKISAIKLAKEQQVAQARRKATPVVGDMRPLADALPELSELTTTIAKPSSTTSRRAKAKATPKKKKTGPTNMSRMKPAKKRKLVESETSWFSQALKNPSMRANSLAAITDQLKKRFKQEEEEQS